jgi:hypothetical protein
MGGNGRAPLRKLSAALNIPGILGFGFVGERPGGPPLAPLTRLDLELVDVAPAAAAAARAAFRWLLWWATLRGLGRPPTAPSSSSVSSVKSPPGRIPSLNITWR